ncbi:MAG: type II toxin-antitoxin system VapC family toxin [Candidatus Bathyarchaeia archaeon]
MKTPRYVVDASVIAKWVLPGEPYQEGAVKLKEDFVAGVVELCAPNFVVEEVANALWRAIKLERISEKDAKMALEALGDMKIELHETNWAQASHELDIACKLNLTVYDASYLLLTNKTKTSLITADKKLYENAKHHFKIMHIKEYP